MRKSPRGGREGGRDRWGKQFPLAKDRLRTVHQEDRLQDVLVSVAALRKRCAGLKPSNFNSQELRAAVRGVLKMG